MALIIGEVFANAVNGHINTNLKAGKLATDYTDMVAEIATYGDTVHFPTIDEIVDADVVTKGTALTPAEVSMTDCEATIKPVGHSARIYDKDSIQIKGNVKQEIARQLGYKMAKAVDADLVAEMRTNAVYKDTAETLTAAAIDDAFEVFGDELDNDTFAGVLINSRLVKVLRGLDVFTDANKTYAANGNGIIDNGLVGYIYGTIPVYVSDKGTYNDNKALFAIVKKGALGIIWQKAPTVEEEREAKLFATDIVVSELYATKLIRPAGVSILEVGAAATAPDTSDTE